MISDLEITGFCSEIIPINSENYERVMINYSDSAEHPMYCDLTARKGKHQVGGKYHITMSVSHKEYNGKWYISLFAKHTISLPEVTGAYNAPAPAPTQAQPAPAQATYTPRPAQPAQAVKSIEQQWAEANANNNDDVPF